MSRSRTKLTPRTERGYLLALRRDELRAAMEDEIAGHRPQYRRVGLLAPADDTLPLDPLWEVGLGSGASLRARILVFKALIAELEDAIREDAARPGAPKKWLSADESRAISVIVHVWGLPHGAYTLATDAIHDVVADECRRLQAKDPSTETLFQGGDATVMPSVSRGLAALGMNSDDLLAKRWSERVGSLLAELEEAQQLAKNMRGGLSAKA